jgi:hypothetical protein
MLFEIEKKIKKLLGRYKPPLLNWPGQIGTQTVWFSGTDYPVHPISGRGTYSPRGKISFPPNRRRPRASYPNPRHRRSRCSHQPPATPLSSAASLSRRRSHPPPPPPLSKPHPVDAVTPIRRLSQPPPLSKPHPVDAITPRQFIARSVEMARTK